MKRVDRVLKSPGSAPLSVVVVALLGRTGGNGVRRPVSGDWSREPICSEGESALLWIGCVVMKRMVTDNFARSALALVATVLLAGTAHALVLDGVASVGEWDDAQMLISDPNEALIPDSYDVERISIQGTALALHMAVEVYNDAPSFAPAPPVPTGRAFLNFDWNRTDGSAQYYGLTYNNHKGFPVGELHVIEYDDGTRTAFTDLGLASFDIGSAIEFEMPWGMFSAMGPADGVVTFDSFAFLYNNGGMQPDDDESNSTLVTNDPVPTVPEPLTLTGLILGCGASLPRLLRAAKRTGGVAGG